MSEPMSDERLAEIRVIAADRAVVARRLTKAMRELLAEVERLRSETVTTDIEWGLVSNALGTVGQPSEWAAKGTRSRWNHNKPADTWRLVSRVVGPWREVAE